MEKEKILFIINPISGAKNKSRIPGLIQKHLDLELFDVQIELTTYPGHAELLCKEGLRSGFKKVVAVGGDGTINEIARNLIGLDCSLGIIPSGSGNGLSRHLGLPLHPIDAIKVINKNFITKIDCGFVNEKPFLCTAGVGFDAHIGKLFAESKIRGLNTYIRTTLAEFLTYAPHHYSISVNGEQIEEDAFLITFANAAQYGNNAYISPQANIKDGLIDLCLLKPFPKMNTVSLGISLFNKSIHKSRFLTIIKCKDVTITRADDGPVHLDGEPFQMGKSIHVEIAPLSLNVLVSPERV